MINIGDINFTQEDEEAIIDKLFQGLMQSTDVKQLEKDIDNIKLESKKIVKLLSDENSRYKKIIKLLQAREELSKKIDDYNKILRSNTTLSQSDMDEMRDAVKRWEGYKKRYSALFYKKANWQQYSLNLFKQIMQYQTNLNKILGQQTEVHFVLYNAGNPLVYKLDLNDDTSIKRFLKARYNKNTFTGAFTGVSKKALDELQYSALDNELLYDTSQYLSNAYHNVMYRYNKAKKVNSNRIFWKEGNAASKYGVIEVGQKGDINEAYALFFFKKKEFLHDNNVEKRVKYYAEEGIMSIDAVSGLLTGDISLSNGRELAIKSAGASMLSFNQVETIAKKITTQWGGKSSEQFLKALFKEKIDAFAIGAKGSVGRNKLKEDIEESLIKDLNKEAEAMLSSYKIFELNI